MDISLFPHGLVCLKKSCLNFGAEGTSLLSASITLTKIEVSFVKNKIHSLGSLSIKFNIKGLNRVLKA